jgi:hypothetical protein
MNDPLLVSVLSAASVLAFVALLLAAWLGGRYCGYLEGLTDGAAAQAENDAQARRTVG